MVDQLNSFASEVTRVAKEVATEGRLGGQAQVQGVAGVWKDLTDNVNFMAANLTGQVRAIAEVTTAALTSRAYDGQSLPITGPEALSYAEMTAKISAVIGKRIRYQAISDDEERQRMLERGEAADIVAAHLSIYGAIREGRLATVTDTVERVLGRRPMTFDQWLKENATAFRNSADAS